LIRGGTDRGFRSPPFPKLRAAGKVASVDSSLRVAAFNAGNFSILLDEETQLSMNSSIYNEN
jgi:hypothetical protein